jgi:flagellar protein FliT
MLNSQQTIAAYENLLLITQKMLEAAKISDIQQMQYLEDRFTSQVRSIRNANGFVKLTGELRHKKIQLLHHILENDKAIRDITDPWLKELSALISNINEKEIKEIPIFKSS